METPSSPLAAARGYAALGYEVFPVRGKVPAISTEDGGHGLHDASSDDAQIVEWFENTHFNIGIAIPPGVVVLDVDKQHDGHKQYLEWTNEHGSEWMHNVPRQRTGQGGIHAWFRHEGRAPRYARRDIPGIELGSLGRYVIVAPSIHPLTNRAYKWEIALPALVDLAIPLPEWMLELYADDRMLEPTSLRSSASGDDELDVAVHEYTSFSEQLGNAGWRLVKGDGNEDRSVWRHPNATGKQSATIKYGVLFVYSPNTPFRETAAGAPAGITLFTAFSMLSCGGDWKRAAAVLRDAGKLESAPDYAEVDTLIAKNAKTKDLTPQAVEAVLGSLKPPAEQEAAADDAPNPFEDRLGIRIDWTEFWREEDEEEQLWLSEPLIATGRAHALYAGAKTGKSLLLLQCAAALATGRPFLDKAAHDPVSVVYADYEMTASDVRQRLSQFGYGPEDDLSAFSYYFLGAGKALDTLEGGIALIETAVARRAQLVIVDTMARAVGGGENDADTIRAFYRASGIGLKRCGIAWVRVDHGGKDLEKGQRGSSAKNDDVDVVWRLTPASGDGAFDLDATHQRMGWVPKKVPLELFDDNASKFEWRRRGGRIYPDRTNETSDWLAKLDIPLDASRRRAAELLRADGWEGRNDLVGEALAFRREQAQGTELSRLVKAN